MITYWADIHSARHPQRLAEMQKAIVRRDAGGVWIDTDLAPEAARQPTVSPVPAADWPVWAKTLARFAGPTDLGLGDVVHHRLGIGGALYQWAYHALTQRDCGCGGRRGRLNAKYPL